MRTIIGSDLELNELDTVYLRDTDRYVVSLVAGYSADEVKSAQQAAAAAAALVVLDKDSDDVLWHVFDRDRGESSFHTTESVWDMARKMAN